jgi:GWxTD domain-containing protein
MRALFYFFLLTALSAHSQALRDINYKYLYDGSEPFTFQMKSSRLAAYWETHFILQPTDTTTGNLFSVSFEWRKSLFEKEGSAVPSDSVHVVTTDSRIRGNMRTGLSDGLQIVVAKVFDRARNRVWFYYNVLEPKYPDNTFIEAGGTQWLRKYVPPGNITLRGENTFIASYYNDNFPAAPPAFSEQLGKVSRGMSVDSTFRLPAGEPVTLTTPGLYLVQYDTNAVEGLAFRVEDDYPRFGRIENLADPLIYICTRQEYDRMKAAKGDKRAFDKIILSITGDAGRARVLMKSYFRRVEMANLLFTSYKEGWKTDKGMIYIVFGPPNEVYRFLDREVWKYSNNSVKISFDFAKSPSLFDPESYVLIRSKKFTEAWYEIIDLWRNARF